MGHTGDDLEHRSAARLWREAPRGNLVARQQDSPSNGRAPKAYRGPRGLHLPAEGLPRVRAPQHDGAPRLPVSAVPDAYLTWKDHDGLGCV